MIGLIAEIYNKISKDGRNLSDRLEDQLTGDFFGTLRYMSFKSIQHLSVEQSNDYNIKCF